MNNHSIQYRRDIDGLRAIAVIPVVIFHAFPFRFSGGFVGVDVFFVISGYLISSIIISKVEKDSFHFVDFYFRRIRRIYPALLAVLISCLIFGYFALFNIEYQQLAKHVAGSSIFISNFILLFETGYFDTASVTKPLLHLWSLGIEEQFYIIWPLIIYISFKLRFNLLKIILFFFILSFAFNIYEIHINQSSDFYLPFTRFWELNTGGILAVILSNTNSKMMTLRVKINEKMFFLNKLGGSLNLLSVIGIFLLIYSYFTFSEKMAFPGFYAIIPVLGASLLILSGSDALINRYILSIKPLVLIGIISYPIYLWHWPLLSFSYIVNSGFQSAAVRVGLILLAVLLSWITYFFIEKKIRYGKKQKFKTIMLFLLMIIVGNVGLYIYKHEGLVNRFPDKINEIKDEQTVTVKLGEAIGRCNKIFPKWMKYTDNACAMQNQSGNNSVAIIGDSHAGHLFTGLSEIRHDGIVVFPASCALPFVDAKSALVTEFLKYREHAYELINSAYLYVIKDKNIHEVILAHNPRCSYNAAIDVENLNIKSSSEVIERAMRRSLTLLISAGKKVIIIKDNPELPYIPEKCVVRPLQFGNRNKKCLFSKAVYENDIAVKVYNSILDRVLKDYPMVSVVDLSKLFCDKNKCYVSKNGHVLYRDIGHLNRYGSRFVAPYINKELKTE